MFEVIGLTPQYPWGEYFRSIVNFSQQIIRFSFNTSNINLVTSVLSACNSLLHSESNATPVVTGSIPAFTPAVTGSLPALIEMSSSVLSGSNNNNELKKTAIILFISCARMDSTYKDTAYQHGFKFIRDTQLLNSSNGQDQNTDIRGKPLFLYYLQLLFFSIAVRWVVHKLQ